MREHQIKSRVELPLKDRSAAGQALAEALVPGCPNHAALVLALPRRESSELLRRESAYRGDRPHPRIAGRCVILVDDGVATGATMRAAIAALRQQNPARIVVAVPVAAAETAALLQNEADAVVCLATPAPFRAIGQWYADFSEVSDDEVCRLLAGARERPRAP